MKKILFAGAVLVAAVTAAGSSSSTQDPGIVNNNNNNQTGAVSGVDKKTPYPTADIGIVARKGSVAGNRIQNYKFIGYGTDNSAAKLDTSKGTGSVQLADYFDPASSKYAIIILNVAARWCGPCNQETDEIVSGVAATYGPQKVVFVQAVTEGLDYKAATMDDLNGWIGDHTNNFTTLLDPSQQNLGVFFDRAAIPFNAVIDARSMEILYAGTGAPSNFGQFLDKYLNLVKTIPAKP